MGIFDIFKRKVINADSNTIIGSAKAIPKSNNQFKMCDKTSIALAFSNLDKLSKLLEKNKALFKSFRSISCSKDDLIRSFYFLNDVTIFCKKEPIFNSSDLQSNVGSLQALVNLYFIDVDPNLIPSEFSENYEFGSKNKIDESQIDELKLINWRNKDQWKYWAAKYGDNECGKYCFQMAEKATNR
jgi:hypothetical protein